MDASECFYPLTSFFVQCRTSDDTVEVGAKLYELDTEAEPTIVDDEESSPTITSMNDCSNTTDTNGDGEVMMENVINDPTPVTSGSHRTPSIKFLGKDGWEAVLSGNKVEATPVIKQTSPLAVTIIRDNTGIHPMYGRPAFSEAEMEALIMGGATVAPTVVQFSKGAKFQY